jgi:hypothetical protein
MQRFLSFIICISLVSCASVPAYAEDLPPPPLEAPATQTVTLDADLYQAMISTLQNLAIENAKLCAGPAASQTWHCNANAILSELQKRNERKQNTAETKPK